MKIPPVSTATYISLVLAYKQVNNFSVIFTWILIFLLLSFLCNKSCDVAAFSLQLLLSLVLFFCKQAGVSVPVLSVGPCLHFFGYCFFMFRELDLWCIYPKPEKLLVLQYQVQPT